jgi:hypothetical protein
VYDHILGEKSLDQERYRSFRKGNRDNESNLVCENSLDVPVVSREKSSRCGSWRLPMLKDSEPFTYPSDALQIDRVTHKDLPEPLRQSRINRDKRACANDLEKQCVS